MSGNADDTGPMELFHDSQQTNAVPPQPARPTIPAPSAQAPQPRSFWRGAYLPIAIALVAVIALSGTAWAALRFTPLSHVIGYGGAAQTAAATSTATTTPRPQANIHEIALDARLSSPTAMALAPDGSIWLLDPRTNTIGRRSPSGALTDFAAPSANAGLTSLTIASDGAVWFTEYDAKKFGRIDKSGRINEFSSNGGNPAAITASSNGAVWILEQHASFPGYNNDTDEIYQFGPGSIPNVFVAGAAFEVGTTNPDVVAAVTTPNGRGYFADNLNNTIADVDPTLYKNYGDHGPNVYSNRPTSYFQIEQSGSGVVALAAASDNSIWYAEQHDDAIGHYVPGQTFFDFGTQSVVGVPTMGSGLAGIAVAPDGSVWFTEATANQIGHLTADGTITEYAIPTANAGLTGIAVTPDGKVWFTETLAGKLGYLIPSA